MKKGRGSGWHKESKRHSDARKYGRAGGRAKPNRVRTATTTGKYGWAWGKCSSCGKKFKSDATTNRDGKIVARDYFCAPCKEEQRITED